MRIYCSGPLFSPEEVGGMQAIAQVVEAAEHTTFLPHRDGLEPYVMRFGDTPLPPGFGAIRQQIDYAIFALDVYELTERCDAVVCNLNGRVPDEGMIVEAALAFAAGKPIVLYKDDARAPFGGYDNSMLTGLVRGKVVRKLGDLPAAVQEAAAGQNKGPVELAADMQAAVAHGKRIAAILAKLPARLGKKQWDEDVIRAVLAGISQ
jgi:nucleoside 2-deoxyribosyltransferase